MPQRRSLPSSPEMPPYPSNPAPCGRKLPLSAGKSDQLSETLRVEVLQKPGPSLAQHRLATQIEQLKIELCSLKGCRHDGYGCVTPPPPTPMVAPLFVWSSTTVAITAPAVATPPRMTILPN